MPTKFELAYAIARNRAMLAEKLSGCQEIVRKNYRARIAFFMRKLSLSQRKMVIEMSHEFSDMVGGNDI